MTLDLSNPDRLPFRDLPDDVAAGMFLAWRKGEVVEFLASDSIWFATGSDGPAWSGSSIYRIRPEPKTADVIPWAALQPQWRWAARNEDGGVAVFTTKPALHAGFWYGELGGVRRVDDLLVCTAGTCSWRDSLQQRPEGV